MKTGVQQIMIGSVCGTEEKTAEALKRIKAAGYDGIELNRFMIHPSSWMVRLMTKAAGMPTGNCGKHDWNRLVKQSGLSVISLHADLGSLENEPDAVIREAKELGTDTVVITGMYRFDYADSGAVNDLAQRLNACGSRLSDNGIALLYHNHNAELVRTGTGSCAYELLLEHTDPASVNFEFDSYWFTDGGADPCLWMKRLGKRMKLWHINDRGSRLNKTAMTPILKADSMELGTGSMNLDTLLKEAETNSVETVVLESHKNWIDGDPLKSIELSSKWLEARCRTK